MIDRSFTTLRHEEAASLDPSSIISEDNQSQTISEENFHRTLQSVVACYENDRLPVSWVSDVTLAMCSVKIFRVEQYRSN